MHSQKHRGLVPAAALALILPELAGAVTSSDAEARALAAVAPDRRASAVVVAWNEAATTIAEAEDHYLTFKGQRALAMMHLAMHDALNAVVPVYQTYLPAALATPGAHPVAAAAQAAHDVLAAAYPDQRARLDAELGRWLAGVADGAAAASGVELGARTAAAIVAARAGDGWDAQAAYRFRAEPGAYATTPDWQGFVAWPAFRRARPFALASPSALRPAPPPALASEAYARDFREVAVTGARASANRSADQTGYALWWMEFAESSVNRLLRTEVAARDEHLWRAARQFAWLAVGLYDAYVATWDAKYEYDSWRPWSAIRGAAGDGNAATEPEPGWESLRPAPPFPEYPSAHAAACAAAFAVLERGLGGPAAFAMRTTTAPAGMSERRFASFAAAAEECADSRIRLGWHFRFATDAGLELGRAVAACVVGSTLGATRAAATGGT